MTCGSVRVVLADDQRLMREGLRALLEAESGFDVVGETGIVEAVLGLVVRLSPHVLVLDVGQRGLTGVDIARRLFVARSPVRVLAVSALNDRRLVQEMLKAGAAGFVTKDASGADLVRAIRALAEGQSFLSPDVAHAVLGDYARACDVEHLAPPSTCLGARERAVLRLIADGEHSPAIAVRLGIAVGTVDAHRRNLMRKLDLHTVSKLTKYAIREGLTSP